MLIYFLDYFSYIFLEIEFLFIVTIIFDLNNPSTSRMLQVTQSR